MELIEVMANGSGMNPIRWGIARTVSTCVVPGRRRWSSVPSAGLQFVFAFESAPAVVESDTSSAVRSELNGKVAGEAIPMGPEQESLSVRE